MLAKYILEFALNIKEDFNTMCKIYLCFVSFMVGLSTISSVLLVYFIRKMENRKSDIKTVTNVIYKRKNFTNDFLLAYILPVLSFFNIGADIRIDIISLLFCVILILIFTFFAYKQNYIFSNIIMELFDYRQYLIKYSIDKYNDMESILIVKGEKFKEKSIANLVILDGFSFMK